MLGTACKGYNRNWLTHELTWFSQTTFSWLYSWADILWQHMFSTILHNTQSHTVNVSRWSWVSLPFFWRLICTAISQWVPLWYTLLCHRLLQHWTLSRQISIRGFTMIDFLHTFTYLLTVSNFYIAAHCNLLWTMARGYVAYILYFLKDMYIH